MQKRRTPPSRTTPQLSIRSEYAVRRARELVQQSGKSATQVVEEALRVYQSREISANSEGARRARLRAITEEVAGSGPHPTMREIDEEMYDEFGLPR